MVAVPATPALSAQALAPAGILASAPALGTVPVHTTLHVRSEQLERARGAPRHRHGTLEESHGHGRPGRLVLLQGLAGRRLADARFDAHRRARPLPHQIHATPAGSERVRLRFAATPTAVRRTERLGRLNVVPPRRRVVVRRRRRTRLRRLADELDAGRRQQDAAVRHAGDAALRRAHRARPGDRPRTVCRGPRIRSHRSHQGGARLRRHRRGVEHPLSAGRWACSCRGWLSSLRFRSIP